MSALHAENETIKKDTALLRVTLPSMHTTVLGLRDTQSRQWEAEKLQTHEKLMQWLSPTDFSTQQQDILSRRQEGTGQWFLDSPEFRRWLEGSERTLFCPGMPGAGKTMISAITNEHLYTTARRSDVESAYLFCNYKDRADQSTGSLISNLLKQLVQDQPDWAHPVRSLYERHRSGRPSMSEIAEALQLACARYTTIYVVVDALDEYADNTGSRKELIDILRKLQSHFDVRLMVTSRYIQDILQQFESSTILEVRASEEDVRRFVAGQMSRLPKYDSQLKVLIEDKIAEAVEGM